MGMINRMVEFKCLKQILAKPSLPPNRMHSKQRLSQMKMMMMMSWFQLTMTSFHFFRLAMANLRFANVQQYPFCGAYILCPDKVTFFFCVTLKIKQLSSVVH